MAVSAPLSWGDLISRVSEEVTAKADQPPIGFWPGVDDASGAKGPAPSEAGAAGPREVSQEAGTSRSRVLPSLLPLAIPLSERKLSVDSGAADSRSSPRSRLPKPGPRQTGAPPTELLRPPAADDAPAPREDARSAAPGTFDAGQIRAVVEEHLRRRSAAGEGPVAPAAGERGPAAEVDARPTGRHRREDFWKRRLRSYAARG
ncbi:hypothetical protein ACUSIJ_02460 [Pseudochelatococcus sp. B33]